VKIRTGRAHQVVNPKQGGHARFGKKKGGVLRTGYKRELFKRIRKPTGESGQECGNASEGRLTHTGLQGMILKVTACGEGMKAGATLSEKGGGFEKTD